MAAKAKVETVSDLFPSEWLKASDLGGRKVTVRIAEVSFEDLRQRDGTTQIVGILRFQNAHKRLILNRTMCHSLITLTGTERLKEWEGRTVILSPSQAPNGRATIAIERALGDVSGEKNNQAAAESEGGVSSAG